VGNFLGTMLRETQLPSIGHIRSVMFATQKAVTGRWNVIVWEILPNNIPAPID
jgi:hypothetical protein